MPGAQDFQQLCPTVDLPMRYLGSPFLVTVQAGLDHAFQRTDRANQHGADRPQLLHVEMKRVTAHGRLVAPRALLPESLMEQSTNALQVIRKRYIATRQPVIMEIQVLVLPGRLPIDRPRIKSIAHADIEFGVEDSRCKRGSTSSCSNDKNWTIFQDFFLDGYRGNGHSEDGPS